MTMRAFRDGNALTAMKICSLANNWSQRALPRDAATPACAGERRIDGADLTFFRFPRSWLRMARRAMRGRLDCCNSWSRGIIVVRRLLSLLSLSIPGRCKASNLKDVQLQSEVLVAACISSL